MKDDDRLVNAIIEFSQELKGMRKDMNKQLGDLNNKVDGLNNRVEKLEKEQAKTNALLGEHSRSILTLAEHINLAAEHEKRIYKLEKIVLRKAG
jgi:peptidoglycan hydrolase CwlO-like protein